MKEVAIELKGLLYRHICERQDRDDFLQFPFFLYKQQIFVYGRQKGEKERTPSKFKKLFSNDGTFFVWVFIYSFDFCLFVWQFFFVFPFPPSTEKWALKKINRKKKTLVRETEDLTIEAKRRACQREWRVGDQKAKTKETSDKKQSNQEKGERAL